MLLTRGKGLLASEMGPEAEGHDLPDNQWQIEVSLWFATTLTAMQNAALEWAHKPWATESPPREAYINTTTLRLQYQTLGLVDEFNELCGNQLVRSEEPVQNFGVLATLLAIIVSLAVVILGMTLPCCVEAHREKARGNGELSAVAARKDVARRADDRFQLLRMALEDAGIRGWEEGLWGVPVIGAEAAKTGRLRVAEPVVDNEMVRYPNCVTDSHPASSPRKKSVSMVEIVDVAENTGGK